MTNSLKWTLDEYCWSYFHKCYITLDITIFTAASQLKDLQILLCRVLFVFKQKQLATLNNIRALLKSVLTDLGARNFLHAKTFLRARCVHVRHCARNLSSTVIYQCSHETNCWHNVKTNISRLCNFYKFEKTDLEETYLRHIYQNCLLVQQQVLPTKRWC